MLSRRLRACFCEKQEMRMGQFFGIRVAALVAKLEGVNWDSQYWVGVIYPKHSRDYILLQPKTRDNRSWGRFLLNCHCTRMNYGWQESTKHKHCWHVSPGNEVSPRGTHRAPKPKRAITASFWPSGRCILMTSIRGRTRITTSRTACVRPVEKK